MYMCIAWAYSHKFILASASVFLFKWNYNLTCRYMPRWSAHYMYMCPIYLFFNYSCMSLPKDFNVLFLCQLQVLSCVTCPFYMYTNLHTISKCTCTCTCTCTCAISNTLQFVPTWVIHVLHTQRFKMQVYWPCVHAFIFKSDAFLPQCL